MPSKTHRFHLRVHRLIWAALIFQMGQIGINFHEINEKGDCGSAQPSCFNMHIIVIIFYPYTLLFPLNMLCFFILWTSQVKSWELSFASVWNSIVWLMLLNFFVKIVNSTAQTYLKKQQEVEMAALKKKSEESEDNSH